jgi:RNA polymerase sigma factor (sigma-70 family)
MPFPLSGDLQHHIASVRRLASSLVGAADVDDVLQEVALQLIGLKKPVQRPVAFLRRVVKNLSSAHRRSEGRRRRREALVRRPEPAEDVCAIAAHLETLQRMSVALSALPPQCGEAIVLRYFEELTPSEIAKHLGVPVPTVKSRIVRGLDLLRAHLARESSDADWRAPLAATFGLAIGSKPPVAGVLATSVTIMAGTKVLLVSAIAVFLLWLTVDDSSPTEPAVVATAVPELGVGVQEQAKVVPLAEDSERQSPAQQASDVAMPAYTVVRGCCVNGHGAPLEGCEVLLSAEDPLGDVHLFQWARENYDPRWSDPLAQKTGLDGRFEWRFVAHEPLVFTLQVRSALGVGKRVQWPSPPAPEALQPGGVVDLGDVTLSPGMLVSGRVRDDSGQPVACAAVRLSTMTVGGDAGALRPITRCVATTDVSGLFAADVALPLEKVLVSVEDGVFEGGENTKLFEAGLPSSWLDIVVHKDIQNPTIRGIVVDDAGRPVPGAVVVADAGGQDLDSSKVRAGGTFCLQGYSGVPRVDRILVRNLASEDTVLEGPFDWGTKGLRVVMRTGATCSLKVEDADGTLVEQFASVMCLSDLSLPETPHLDQRLHSFGSHPGGVAGLGKVRSGTHWLHVEPLQSSGLVASLARVVVAPGRSNTLEVRLPRGAEREVRVVDALGRPVAGACVELIEVQPEQVGAPVEGLPAEELLALANWDRKGLLRQRFVTNVEGTVRLRGPAGGHFVLNLPGPMHQPVQFGSVDLNAHDPIVVRVLLGAGVVVRLEPAGMGEALCAYQRLFGGTEARSAPEFYLRAARGSGSVVRGALAAAGDEVEFSGCAPGEWEVVLSLWGGSETKDGNAPGFLLAKVDLADGDRQVITPDLAQWVPGKLQGVVRINGEPLVEEWVYLIAEDGVTGGIFGPRRGSLRTGPKGEFSATLPSGSYRLVGEVPSEERVVIRPGSSIEQEFSVYSGRVVLQLSDHGGQLVKNRRIRALDAQGRSLAIRYTDESGLAEFVLPCAVVRLWCDAESGAVQSGSGTLLGTITVGGGSEVRRDFVLPRSN